MKRGIVLAATFLLISVLIGCDYGSLLGSESETAARGAKGVLTTGPGYQMVEGEIGPGSLYALYLPTDPQWNGSLVVYAHGYVDPSLDVALPIEMSEAPFLNLKLALLDMGYGVAYSSYSENGYAVKDGITRTRQLKGLFKANFGKPDQTYLIGVSLGGLMGVAIAEKHSNLVDGVLSICGPVGGSSFQFEHIVHVRALFDLFYPTAFGGGVYTLPPNLVWSNDLRDQLGALIGTNPFPFPFPLPGAVLISSISPVDMALGGLSPAEQGASIVAAIGFNIVATRDVLERTHGHIPVGNRDTVYSSDWVNDHWLNEQVERFDSTPDAENYMEHWYVPTGRLRVPVVTLHNLRDPAVPYSHEAVFEAAVDEAGKRMLLKQIPVDRFGHVEVTPAEVVGAFGLLIGDLEIRGRQDHL